MARMGWMWAALALAACGGDKDDTTPTDDTGDTQTPTGDEIFSAFTVEPGAIPGVMLATATTTEAGTVRIEYGLDAALGTASPEGASGTSHSRAVLGVKTGRTYTFQAVFTGSDGTERRSAAITARVDPTDVSVPTFNVGKPLDTSIACDDGGFLLVSYLGQNNSGVAIVDRDGDVVWALPFAQTNVQLARTRPGVDGVSITYTTADGNRIEQIGQIVRQPIDGSPAVVTYTDTSHHDYIQHADGSYGWLGYTFGAYTCEDGTTFDDTATDTIMESADGASFDEAVEVFNVFDDYGLPLDCDINDENFLPGFFDISHANSLAYRESDDAYFLMWRSSRLTAPPARWCGRSAASTTTSRRPPARTRPSCSTTATCRRSGTTAS